VALSDQADLPPTRCVFDPEPRGKPVLTGPAELRLQFNRSHARGVAVCAFTMNEPIGVDVEVCRPNGEMMEIAGRYFSQTELKVLERLAPQDALEAALQLWTLKEAFLKATGLGLRVPLRDLGITLEPSGPSRLEFAHNIDHYPDDW